MNQYNKLSTGYIIINREQLRGRGPPQSVLGLDEYPPKKDDARLQCWIANGSEQCWVGDENLLVPYRVQVHLLEMKKIDTVAQEYEAQFWIQIKWKERIPTGTDISKPIPSDQLTKLGIGKWLPKLSFLNVAADVSKDEALRIFHYQDDPFAYLYQRYIVRGFFSQKMELEAFPFDIQQLSIRTVCWNAPEAVNGTPLNTSFDDKPAPCRKIKFEVGENAIYERGFIPSTTWDRSSNLILRQGVTDKIENEEGIQYSTLDVILRVERKPLFYMINIALPVFLLGMISFMSFLLGIGALNDRLNLTVVILLTVVAFRFSIGAYLPVTSAFTLLDKYLTIALIYPCSVALVHTIVFVLATNLLPSFISLSPYAFNFAASVFLTVSWILLHMALPIFSHFSFARQRESNAREDESTAQYRELERSLI